MELAGKERVELTVDLLGVADKELEPSVTMIKNLLSNAKESGESGGVSNVLSCHVTVDD